MPSAKPQTVLILQGGGALGSYQGGAVQGLVEHDVDFDWVVGTSIGAINIVRIIMKALAEDSHSKDIDFSRSTLNARWAAGQHDVERVFQHKSWLKSPANDVGLAVHELVQE